jgi:acetyl esterase/lipase
VSAPEAAGLPKFDVMNEPAPQADARLSYGDSPSQFADFRRPASASGAPLVVMIHGGYWRSRRDLTYAGHLCQALSEANFTSVNIEYRRAGEPGGGWPGTFDDMLRAVEFARRRAPEFDGDPVRTIVIGHSAGGHLALWLGCELDDLLGAVALAPVANLQMAWELHLSNDAVVEFLGGTPHEVPDRYRAADPAHRPGRSPRILIHGTEDDIVPVAVSRSFPAPLIELPGVDHFEPVNPRSDAWGTVVSVLNSISQYPSGPAKSFT